MLQKVFAAGAVADALLVEGERFSLELGWRVTNARRLDRPVTVRLSGVATATPPPPETGKLPREPAAADLPPRCDMLKR